MLNFLIRFLNFLYNKIKKKKARNWQDKQKRELGSCGSGVVLSPYSTFIGSDAIQIGDNVHIGFNGWFRGDGGLTIGDNTHISRNCTIFTASHDYKGARLPYDDNFIRKPVAIGENVWIGMNVMILPGVTIGEGAIIGLGTLVTGDIPPLAIVGSQECKILKYRDKDHYYELKQAKKFGGRGGQPLVDE